MVNARHAVALSLVLAGCGPRSGAQPSNDDPDGSSTSGSGSAADDAAEPGDVDESTAGAEGSSGEAGTDDTGDTADSSGGPPLPTSGLGPFGFAYLEVPQIEALWVGFADFDGDGITDVFARDSAGFSVYGGDGQGAFGLLSQVEAPSFVELMRAGDFDGDGDTDAALFGGTEAFSLLRNDGAGSFPDVDEVAVPGFYSFGVLPLRLDSDGGDDLFVPQGHSSGATLALAQGDGTFVVDAQVPQPACYFSGTAAADLDGDGLDDVVATGSCNAIPQTLPLVVYRHGAAGLEAAESIIGQLGAVTEGADVRLFDVDDDGDLDILTPTEQGIYVVTNGGEGSFVDPPSLLPHVYEGYVQDLIPITVGPADDVGLVLQSVEDSSDANAALVLPSGEWTTSETELIDLNGRIAGAADFDGDGATDIAVLIGEDTSSLGLWLSGG